MYYHNEPQSSMLGKLSPKSGPTTQHGGATEQSCIPLRGLLTSGKLKGFQSYRVLLRELVWWQTPVVPAIENPGFQG